MKFQSLQPTEELLTRIFTAIEKQILFYNQVKSQDQWIPEKRAKFLDHFFEKLRAKFSVCLC